MVRQLNNSAFKIKHNEENQEMSINFYSLKN